MMQGRKAEFEDRVVLLCGDPSVIESLSGEPLAIVHVQSAYQAAAELLAAPVAVLAVDLQYLTPRHKNLLRIARDTGAMMIGFGTLGENANTDALSGLRLAASSKVADEIRALLESESEMQFGQPAWEDIAASQTSQPETEFRPAREETGRYVSQSRRDTISEFEALSAIDTPSTADPAPSGGVDASSASMQPETNTEPPRDGDADEQRHVASQSETASRREPANMSDPESTADLLSPEELSALLESD